MKDFFTEADCDEKGFYFGTNHGPLAGRPCLSLERANHLLRERGAVVYGTPEDGWPDSGSADDWHTHSALVINIEPIEQDSADSLLKEFIRKWDDHNISLNESWPPIIERAKKLLEKK